MSFFFVKKFITKKIKKKVRVHFARFACLWLLCELLGGLVARRAFVIYYLRALVPPYLFEIKKKNVAISHACRCYTFQWVLL